MTDEQTYGALIVLAGVLVLAAGVGVALRIGRGGLSIDAHPVAGHAAPWKVTAGAGLLIMVVGVVMIGVGGKSSGPADQGGGPASPTTGVAASAYGVSSPPSTVSTPASALATSSAPLRGPSKIVMVKDMEINLVSSNANWDAKINGPWTVQNFAWGGDPTSIEVNGIDDGNSDSSVSVLAPNTVPSYDACHEAPKGGDPAPLHAGEDFCYDDGQHLVLVQVQQISSGSNGSLTLIVTVWNE